MLERAAWRLQRGATVAAVAREDGWSAPEVFSRAFRRAFGVPPSQAATVGFRLPAPNGVHFHPPQSLWLDAPGDAAQPDVSMLLVSHDLADTGYLIEVAAELSEAQWAQQISPGQVVLDWDGQEPSVAAVLDALVWAKEIWLAGIEGRDQPVRADLRSAARLAADHRDVAWNLNALIAEGLDAPACKLIVAADDRVDLSTGGKDLGRCLSTPALRPLPVQRLASLAGALSWIALGPDAKAILRRPVSIRC